MSYEEQKEVETTNTTEIAETTNTEKQETEISETVMPVKQTQQTTTDSNGVAPISSKTKKKFVIGTESTEESPRDNRENNDSTSDNKIHKENVENHLNTDTKQKIESEEDDDYVNVTDKLPTTPTTQINLEPQPPQQPIQQPTPKEDKVIETKPITMTPTEAHQAAPVVTNTTVTATTQRQSQSSAPTVKQPPKFILNTPADSPDSTPISSPSPSDGIHDASYVNTSLLKLPTGQNQVPPNQIIDNYMYNQTLDDSYTSEQLNYPHQPRFPPSSNGISRTQQKLLLQRQHFLADDENYLIHPRNQLRLTKVIERINREHAAISLFRDPTIESLQRVWPRFVQEHPEVMDDDFGVGYEDAKEWGVISDHGKSVDHHIGSNSIISNETLGVDSMALRG